MADQKTIEKAIEDGYLDLSRWSKMMVQRIRLNYEMQKIYPSDYVYKDYKEIIRLTNENRRGSNISPSGDSIKPNYLYATLYNNASGNTHAVQFFFRNYLRYVDWGVGKGQMGHQVEDKGSPKWDKRYTNWPTTSGYRIIKGKKFKKHKRGRRPVIFVSVFGGRWYLQHMLELYYGMRGKLSVLKALYEIDYEQPNGAYKSIDTVDLNGEDATVLTDILKRVTKWRKIKS